MTTVHKSPANPAPISGVEDSSDSSRIHPTWTRSTAYLICGIYRLIDPRTGDVRYVGQSIDMYQRFYMHTWEAINIHRTPVQKWIAKLIGVDLEPIIEVVCEAGPDDLDELEKEWVAYYRELGPLLNILDGGGQDALRDYHRGRKQSPEWIAKRVASQKTKPRRQRGPHSPETRANMSIAAKERANRPEMKVRQAEILAEQMATNPNYVKWGTSDRRPKSGVMVFKPRVCDMCGVEFIPVSGGQRYCKSSDDCQKRVYRAQRDRANARDRERRAERRYNDGFSK